MELSDIKGHHTDMDIPLGGDTPSVVYAPAPRSTKPGITPLAHYPGQVDSVELEAEHGFVGVRWIWSDLPGVQFVSGYIKVKKWRE